MILFMFRFLHMLLLLIAIPCALWCIGLLWFLWQIPDDTSPVLSTKADAIVVLTGGGLRLEHGLNLLTHDKGKLLFISGVYAGAKPSEIFSAISPEMEKTYHRYKKRIMVGKEALDTHGNAIETAAWVKKHNVRVIRLVTAAYHMPRSLLEMQWALPDVTIIPDPVFPDSLSGKGWKQQMNMLKFIIGEYHKYLATRLGIHDAL